MATNTEDRVIAAQVNRNEPPHVVAEDIETLVTLNGFQWDSEQCENCGCTTYTVERGPVTFPDTPLAWTARCSGNEDRRRGVPPGRRRPGPGHRRSLRLWRHLPAGLVPREPGDVLMARNYDQDSLRRALDHHVGQGRLRSYKLQPEINARRPWLVTGWRGETVSFTNPECSALCYGLASAQYAPKEMTK